MKKKLPKKFAKFAKKVAVGKSPRSLPDVESPVEDSSPGDEADSLMASLGMGPPSGMGSAAAKFPGFMGNKKKLMPKGKKKKVRIVIGIGRK